MAVGDVSGTGEHCSCFAGSVDVSGIGIGWLCSMAAKTPECTLQDSPVRCAVGKTEMHTLVVFRLDLQLGAALLCANGLLCIAGPRE